ncbi:MAG: hypothetical protein RL522_1728 [Pseudomonadota bacterium]
MRRALSLSRRACLLLAVLSVSHAQADEAGWTALARPGAIVLVRHAHAPGVGDPPGMRLADCTSQRNLDAQGRDEAVRLGERLRQSGLRVGAVLYSPWCRVRETAQLAMGSASAPALREESVFGSFFAGQGDATRQTAAAREILRRWQGPGALLVFTHQVNVQGLTGVSLAPAEGLVVRVLPGEGPLQVLGRISPQD